MDTRCTSTWTTFWRVSRYVTKELCWKQRSWNWNWHSNMFSQVVAWHIVPKCQPLIFLWTQSPQYCFDISNSNSQKLKTAHFLSFLVPTNSKQTNRAGHRVTLAALDVHTCYNEHTPLGKHARHSQVMFSFHSHSPPISQRSASAMPFMPALTLPFSLSTLNAISHWILTGNRKSTFVHIDYILNASIKLVC